MTSQPGDTRRVLDPPPRPRAAILGSQTQRAAVTGVFPTEISFGADDAHSLHLPDFDAVVTFSSALRRELAVDVVSFGAKHIERTSIGISLEADIDQDLYLRGTQTPTGADLRIPDGLPVEVRDLITRTLVPAARQLLRERNVQGWRLLQSTWTLTPLLESSDGVALAFRAQNPSAQDIWVLPDWANDPVAWVKLAWRIWAQSGRMPAPPRGFNDTEWMTQAEQLAHRECLRLAAERVSVLADMDAREASASAALAHAQTAAEDGMRRLLTDEGDGLVDAVSSSLEIMGFQITDVDAERRDTGSAKVEDLRVKQDDEDGWLGLVEVKGSTKGATTAWLMQITRHTTIYAQEHGGSTPSVQWLVVNTHRKQDPGARPEPYTNNNAGDLEAFAEGPGLVIPTRELFQMVRDIEASVLPEAEARRQLVTHGSGRFAYVRPGSSSMTRREDHNTE